MPKQLTHNIDGINVVLQPAVSTIPNSWYVLTGNAVVLRTSLINSMQKVENFLDLTQKLHDDWKSKDPQLKFPFRAVSCQLCTPKTDWDQIFVQHMWFTWLHFEKGLSAQSAHLNLPTDHFYSLKDLQQNSEFFLKAVAKLPEMQNIDAWETYCYWMNEEIEIILEKIPLESMDTYTMEAHLKDFVHEVRSSLLRNVEKDIESDVLKIGALRNFIKFPVKENEDIVELERRLIRARHDARPCLQVQYATLAEIARVINIIEDSHPELVTLKYQARLLTEMMDGHLGIEGKPKISWTKQLLLMQLLHEDLGIVTALNCDTGLDRTSLAFGIVLAISLLKQRHPKDQVIDLALNWDENIREVNREISKVGLEKFDEWVKMPSADSSEKSLKTKATLIMQLRSNFFEVLEGFCIPITIAGGPVQDLKWQESQKENPEFLNLLPVSGIIETASGKRIKSKIVESDQEGNPIGLTKEGHYLMTKLFRKS